MKRARQFCTVAAILVLGTAAAGFAEEAANEKKAAEADAAVQADGPTPAQVRAAMHRTLAELIEARSAAQPDQAKIDALSAELRTQQQRLRAFAPGSGAGPRGRGQCPWAASGMGYGRTGGGPPWAAGNGRGRGAGYGGGFGRGAASGGGFGRGRAFVDQDGDGMCDNLQRIREVGSAATADSEGSQAPR